MLLFTTPLYSSCRKWPPLAQNWAHSQIFCSLFLYTYNVAKQLLSIIKFNIMKIESQCTLTFDLLAMSFSYWGFINFTIVIHVALIHTTYLLCITIVCYQFSFDRHLKIFTNFKGGNYGKLFYVSILRKTIKIILPGLQWVHYYWSSCSILLWNEELKMETKIFNIE